MQTQFNLELVAANRKEAQEEEFIALMKGLTRKWKIFLVQQFVFICMAQNITLSIITSFYIAKWWEKKKISNLENKKFKKKRKAS